MAALPAVLLLLTLPASAEVVAASGNPARWTPESYVRSSLGLSPEARSAEASRDAAAARAKAKWARAFAPSLSFSAKAAPAKLGPRGLFRFDAWRAGANDLSLTPGVSWNLFNSFQDLLSARSSELSREMAGDSLEAARQTEALDALRGFWGLFLRERVLEVSRQNLAIQVEQYDLTQDRYKHGMKSLSDLLKTETDWRSAELRVEGDEATRRLALFRFNIAVGADEGAPAALDADLTLGTTQPPLLDAGLRQAIERRPELVRARRELQQAETSHTLAKIAAGPTLALDFDGSHAWNGDYGRTSLGFGAGSSVYGFALKLALPGSFNLYSQVQDVRASRADLSRAAQTLEAQRRSVREEVYQSHIELSRALRSHEIASRKEDISRQNLELVKQEYSEGSADVLRLSQAQSDFVNAQVERMQALHDVKINTARWKRAVGEPIWR